MMLLHRGIAASADALQRTQAEAPKALPVAGIAPGERISCTREVGDNSWEVPACLVHSFGGHSLRQR